jgi:hypothetical protein
MQYSSFNGFRERKGSDYPSTSPDEYERTFDFGGDANLRPPGKRYCLTVSEKPGPTPFAEDRPMIAAEARIAADRAGAANRSLFDPSKVARLARKYKAAADRGMHRALEEMKAVEAEAEMGAPAPIPAPPLGSFSPPPAGAAGIAIRPGSGGDLYPNDDRPGESRPGLSGIGRSPSGAGGGARRLRSSVSIRGTS